MSRTFPTRSGAADAARKELGEGKFFRTTQNADGDWKWHYEPGAHVGLGLSIKRDYIAWVEVAWNRDTATPHPVPVAVITCRLEEIDETDRVPHLFLVEPITPELFEDLNAPQPKARRASTGERASSDVENPTKLVWQLADEMKGSTRAEVVAACVERGVHKSTASTQYYRWAKARGS